MTTFPQDLYAPTMRRRRRHWTSSTADRKDNETTSIEEETKARNRVALASLR